jgi:hypothetical protein
MKSRIDWLTVGRAQAGWTVQLDGGSETHTQYTWRWDAHSYGCHRRLAIAFFKAVINWFLVVRSMQAEIGPFNDEAVKEGGKG